MRHSGILAIVALVLFSNCERAFSQTNTNPWPANPPIGIGTQLSTPNGPLNALHIHFDPAHSDTAILRLSEGSGTNTNDFGILGLMPGLGHIDTLFSSLSRGNDLILHDHYDGDIIITNCSPWSASHQVGGAIRFATTGDTLKWPTPSPGHHDLERLTINGNGNIGIDLPPATTGSNIGLDSALDQVQIGGGVMIPPTGGYTTPIPGLTIYGGNRFEGMAILGGGTFPVDWRGIAFNHYENHTTGVSSRFAPMSESGINFAPDDSGLILLTCNPYHTGQSLTDFTGGVTMQITGGYGLSFYCDDSARGGNKYQHLFDCWPPGVLAGGVTRNTNGLFFHHTPVFIGSDTGAIFYDFTNLGVHPNLGDGLTWDLVVNGPLLAKEFYMSIDFPDFVFDPSYKLMPLDELQKFINENHHLPGIASAKELDATGVPIGKTEAALAQKVEELTRYVLQLQDEIDSLKAEKKGEK